MIDEGVRRSVLIETGSIYCEIGLESMVFLGVWLHTRGLLDVDKVISGAAYDIFHFLLIFFYILYLLSSRQLLSMVVHFFEIEVRIFNGFLRR